MFKTSKTTSCERYAHAEFELEYRSDYVLDVDVDWLLAFLSEQVSRGVKYDVGQTIQIGWMLDRIEKATSGLTIAEPDMREVPITFVKGVTNTLRHLRLQKSIAESVGLEAALTFPTIRHSAITCLRHEDSTGFVMYRTKADNRDSGWFIGCDDPKHDHNNPKNLGRRSLYELACSKPECIPFVALPEQSSVRHMGNSVEVWFQKNKLEIKANSYLAKHLKCKNEK